MKKTVNVSFANALHSVSDNNSHDSRVTRFSVPAPPVRRMLLGVYSSLLIFSGCSLMKCENYVSEICVLRCCGCRIANWRIESCVERTGS
eukprot:scaffold91942_cov52-Attheya_sp.AAC.4